MSVDFKGIFRPQTLKQSSSDGPINSMTIIVKSGSTS
eukprot:CAMPEP_0177263512 /NCGR_PEP_ID=MMETSP0367-20130122/61026_1 /TAXON_ID=447022 ORGANISM="Scrippsiella hangoei-like, Strain SHHI-4" /NCGR_SAMPLE_ID=MMETSP0367 /ASSEMBLY_ACC=CAM_ASM_000362 /LENGTH=36 /DNA_ID= /DNA_START= /DNA_END= /DNA_ORIENTATION=